MGRPLMLGLVPSGVLGPPVMNFAVARMRNAHVVEWLMHGLPTHLLHDAVVGQDFPPELAP